jgi:uncharacterized protein (DUF2164 family)
MRRPRSIRDNCASFTSNRSKVPGVPLVPQVPKGGAKMPRPKSSIVLSEDSRKSAVAALRGYFAANLDEEIGDLKAGLLLDFILSELGPSVYNQAIADARSFFEERSNDLAAVCYRDEFPTSRKP